MIEAGRQAGFVLLAVDHGGHCPGVDVAAAAAAAAASDLLDEAGQVLRFLWQLTARPLQELEVFHLATLFPLKAQWVKGEAVPLSALALETGRRALPTGRLPMPHLAVADGHGAAGESRRGLCARYLHLKVPEGFLVCAPVDAVLQRRGWQKFSLSAPQ